MSSFIRERSLERRGCVYKAVHWFVYSDEEQAAARRSRQKRERATLPKVKALNDKRSREIFEWLAQNNFTSGDYFVTFTFKDAVTAKEGKQIFSNFVRRLRRLYKQKSAVLKYLYVEEVGEKGGRYHIHAFISSGERRVSSTEISRLWEKYGLCRVDYLYFTDCGLATLCFYLEKLWKLNPKNKRSWSCSQTCKRPDIVTDDNRISGRTMRKIQDAARNDELISAIERIYSGWQVVGTPDVGVNDVTGREYLCVRLVRKLE